jgi:hypothetical protein
VNDNELERFEAELRRTPPAPLPDQFMAKLSAAKPGMKQAQRGQRRVRSIFPPWRVTWVWLAPSMGVAVAGLFLARANLGTQRAVKNAPMAGNLGFKASDVQVDQELVDSFDVVAKLPGGEPVRFHCRKWKDQVVLTDTNGGVQIERDSPRVEVVPVRFETY